MYTHVANELQSVDTLIKHSLSYRNKSIDMIANYVISAGGKRLRPIFAILSAKLFGYKGNNHIKIATAIELIHTATLLHDDIVDESKTRRGKTTANEKWGNKYAVLVGDFLFSQAFKLMVATDSINVLDILSRSSNIIAEGEIKQLNNIGNIKITQSDYIEVITAKTAELFASACKAGTLIADQDKVIQDKMYQFGMDIGIAFQIIDDILDYTSNSTGKDIGNDFKERKITLPVIFAYEKSTEGEKQSIRKLFDNTSHHKEELTSFTNLLHEYDCFNKSKETALHFLTRAQGTLNKIPKTQEFTDIFDAILKYQMNRVS